LAEQFDVSCQFMSEAMKYMPVLSRCASLALINNVIRSESFEISKLSYTSPADIEKKLAENSVYLTRDTFAAYVDAIIELLAMASPATYTAALLWDKKNQAYRIIGEKFFRETQNEDTLFIFREMSVKTIETAVNKMQTISISGRKGFKTSGHPESGQTHDLLAAPIMNFNQGRGGIVVINPFEKKDSPAGFGYDDNMAVLLLANYLGAFYDNFLSTSTLENKIRSLSIIYTISSISDNFFDSMDFDSAINRALTEISLFMRVYCCALAIYDEDDEELKTYSSLPEDISGPLSSLISSLNMDFWKNGQPGGGMEKENNYSIINLSQVNIYHEPLRAFREDLNAINGSKTDFDINARPIHYNRKPIGYMFFINSATAADEGCQSLCRGNEAETIDFMIAASTILTSMIVAQKNYLTLARLEKYAARMERLASIGEVAAGVAHEIRNPLGGISLFATSLSGSFEEGDMRKKWISQIIEAVGRINGMVSSLLNFSRDEIINKRLVNIYQIVKDVSFFLQKEIKEKEALVEIVPDPAANKGVFNIYCDPEKIKQVFTNL
ncbi:MAG TPA: histidine kinase dimerization/phospho-acceptor domain-containing protein, partial [Candidatus Wallbacteria bacterium]|nr:histidine kinase dimerization/phospho-acceptor domain-containing protein [Candidatus Wallbacteria bacterium]